MDEKSIEVLYEILNQQKEQTELFRRHLWRLRFSLLTLLVIMTTTAIGLGLLTYWLRQTITPVIPPVPPPAIPPQDDLFGCVFTSIPWVRRS